MNAEERLVAITKAIREEVTVALPMGRMMALHDKESGKAYALVNPDALLALVDEALEVRAALSAAPMGGRSDVDEVVARLGGPLPAEVWVVETRFNYEAGDLIGVASTLERAKELAVENNGGKGIRWTEIQTSPKNERGDVGTWVEAVNDYYLLTLEEVR